MNVMKIRKRMLSLFLVVVMVFTAGIEWTAYRSEAANELSGINLYGERAANHCADAALACVEAFRLGLNESDNEAIYWASWAVMTAGTLMPGDGFVDVGKNASAICKMIDSGNAVLLYFSNFNGSGNNHWVVAYGYDGNGTDFSKIKIMCPRRNGNNPDAYKTTLGNVGCTQSNLSSAKAVNGGFIESVYGKTVIAKKEGIFRGVEISNASSSDATIGCLLRSNGKYGHNCNDFGFLISTNKNMTGAETVRESKLNSSLMKNGVFEDVNGMSYKMSKWYKSYNSSNKYYIQFFIEKNGITIKSPVYPFENGNPEPVIADTNISTNTGKQLSGINLYGERAANHCADAALACAEAYRLGLNEKDNEAIYWASWAIMTAGTLMPSDGFTDVKKTSSAICGQIDKGNPVLLYFNNFNGSTNNHWVVAYGYEGDGTDFSKIKIMCPARSGSTPNAYFTTLGSTNCTTSNLSSAKVVNGGFLESVNGNTVIAKKEGIFRNFEVTNSATADATIGCLLRSNGKYGHNCNDFGFLISTNKNMNGAETIRESKLNSSLMKNGVFEDVNGMSYKMSKWYKSYNSSTDYYVQFFIEKNGITIKSPIYPFKGGNPEPIEGDVKPPTVTSARISSVRNSCYRVIVKATDDVGVSKVAFPSWTEKNGQDDLAKDWANDSSITTSELTQNNNYSVVIDFKDHNNESGKYITQIYAYDAAGNSVCGASLEIVRYILSSYNVSLNVGKTQTLSFTPQLAEGIGVTWTSSDTSVAKVDSNGKISAVAPGDAMITAKLSMPEDDRIDYQIATNVTVKGVALESISLSKTALSLEKGSSEKLTVSFTPNDTTDSKNISWKSSDEKVVKVDNGTITAIGAGKATITVTSSANGAKTASCTVTVTEKDNSDAEKNGNNNNSDSNTNKKNLYSEYGLDGKYVPDDYEDQSGSSMIIEGKNCSWNTSKNKSYWYEGGVKQGTYYDPHGVLGEDPETHEATVRGREIYDPGSDAWYWLDSIYDGAKAVGKEVWIPYIYQDEESWSQDEKYRIANESDQCMINCVYEAMRDKKGKWVRYDENGAMLKYWVTIEGALAEKYPNQIGNTYYYDKRTGLMAKGWVTIDGIQRHFDENTGVLITE